MREKRLWPYPGSSTITYAKDSSCASSGRGARRFFFTEFTIRPAMHYREYDIHLTSDPWDLMAAAAPSRCKTSKNTMATYVRGTSPRSRRPFRLGACNKRVRFPRRRAPWRVEWLPADLTAKPPNEPLLPTFATRWKEATSVSIEQPCEMIIATGENPIRIK